MYNYREKVKIYTYVEKTTFTSHIFEENLMTEKYTT